MGYKTNYAVYKITNNITNKSYIGVDSYFPKRLRQHQSMLLNNKHKNKYLQSSYNKYGKDNFTFELLETCIDRETMLLKEIELIKLYNSLENGYNHTVGGEGSFGYKHSEESISKMSSWERIVTPEWRKAISDATRGKSKKKGIKRINHPDYSRWIGGEKHPVAKLKQQDVNNIRKLYNDGETQLSLSKKFNITKTQVYNIVKNKSWKNPNYKLSLEREKYKNSNGKSPIYTNIICIEDEIVFTSIKDAREHYNCSHNVICNNINKLSKQIKTRYGKKSFKKISLDT